MTPCDLDSSVPDWVIDHPETLTVFRTLGIDTCCGGKSLAYACRERGLAARDVLDLLLDALIDENGIPSAKETKMALRHAKPGEVIDVRPLGSALAAAKTHTLLKTDHVEVVRLVMAAGKDIAEHRAPGDITVHCLEGRIAFTALGATRELAAGHMLYLGAGEPHAVACLEDASFLLTILLKP